MKRRGALKHIGLGMAGLTLPRFLFAGNTSEKPNILFIMSDDHAANAISCYGGRLSDVAPTPNIDRLAKEGMRLDNCFCTNSICVPSRASTLTGKYSHTNGVYTLRDAFNPKQTNVAKLLRKAGYQTAVIGKWHLKNDPAGFDYWNILPGQGRYFNPVLKEKDSGKKNYEGHSTDVVTRLSIDWLGQREKDKPFFLMCHFKAPHEPWEYAKRYEDYLSEVDIPKPVSFGEEKSHRSRGSREYGYTLMDMAERQQRKNYHSEGPVYFSGMTEEEIREKTYQIFLKRYLRTIKGVDDNVGRLLQYLDKNNLTENTVIIYTSDQGYFLGEHDYIDKRWMYEESLRMPFLVRYPEEIPTGSVTDEIVLNVDFAPLFLDYAEQSIKGDMQGSSFRNILKGSTPSDWRSSMYYRYWMHTNRPAHYGIRSKRYKLIFFYGLPLGMSGARKKRTKVGWELYDLKNDPYEMNNVYDDPSYSDVVKDLKQELLRLKKELGDTDKKYPELMELREKFWD